MMKEAQTIEPISCDVQGRIIHGQRVVFGAKKLTQTIIFADWCDQDSADYTPDQKNGVMLKMAEQILWQIATGRSLSARPTSESLLSGKQPR